MCVALIYDLSTTGLNFLIDEINYTREFEDSDTKDEKLYKLQRDDVLQYVYD
jgi:hypothetical protein